MSPAEKKEEGTRAKRFDVLQFPFRWALGGAVVETLEQGESMVYRRVLDGDEKRILCSSQTQLRLQPMEPFFVPKELTRNLLIEFEDRVLVMPNDRLKLDMSFPLEIGALIPLQKSWQLLDVFSFAPQKFTLFGDPSHGYVCKYWKSRWVDSGDDLISETEAWLRLTVRNSTSSPVELTRAVCSGHQIQLYHDDQRACCSLSMKVTARDVAELESDSQIPIPKAKKAFDLFSEKKLLGVSQKFIMEGSL